MPVEVSGKSASVKRGADTVADDEERGRWRLRDEGKRGQKARHARRPGTPTQDEGQAGAQEGPEA